MLSVVHQVLWWSLQLTKDSKSTVAMAVSVLAVSASIPSLNICHDSRPAMLKRCCCIYIVLHRFTTIDVVCSCLPKSPMSMDLSSLGPSLDVTYLFKHL